MRGKLSLQSLHQRSNTLVDLRHRLDIDIRLALRYRRGHPHHHHGIALFGVEDGVVAQFGPTAQRGIELFLLPGLAAPPVRQSGKLPALVRIGEALIGGQLLQRVIQSM